MSKIRFKAEDFDALNNYDCHCHCLTCCECSTQDTEAIAAHVNKLIEAREKEMVRVYSDYGTSWHKDWENYQMTLGPFTSKKNHTALLYDVKEIEK